MQNRGENPSSLVDIISSRAKAEARGWVAVTPWTTWMFMFSKFSNVVSIFKLLAIFLLHWGYLFLFLFCASISSFILVLISVLNKHYDFGFEKNFFFLNSSPSDLPSKTTNKVILVDKSPGGFISYIDCISIFTPEDDSFLFSFLYFRIILYTCICFILVLHPMSICQ